MFKPIFNIFFVITFYFSVKHCVDSFPQRNFRMMMPMNHSHSDTLTLPSNATSIREQITDNFSCQNKTYGYYADIENDCQIFHVCLPVTYANGKNQTFRWSFICPETTVFSQENFVCVKEEDLTLRCEDSESFYDLNYNFGDKEEEETDGDKLESDSSNNNEEMNQESQPTMSEKK